MSVDVAQNSVDNLKDDLVIFIDKIAATQVATVPLNWKRILIDNKIVYITPSQQILRSISDVSTYLLSEGTCKCNLACPFFLEFFNFDPQIESVENAIDETKSSCRHRQPNDDYHSAQMYESSPTSSNLIYHQPKVIYTPTIQQATTSHDSTTPTRKIIVQNQAMTGENGRTANYQIQSVLNFKQAEQTNQSGQQQIYGYIQVRKDNLTNVISQPIILTSPIKTSTSSSSPQVLQFLNSSSMMQPMITIQQQQPPPSTNPT